MTEAGMGIHESGNIELNEVQQSENNDFDKAREWFELHWKKLLKIKSNRESSL
jgi:hypothetical protein